MPGDRPAPHDRDRVTIGDVATRAGVSPTTVSHVLSGKRVVGAATRDRVREAVRELGYRPNSAARQLRTKRSRMVAVIVPDITNPFYGVLTRGLADVVGDGGYGAYVCNTDGSLERERTFLHDVHDRGVDGVVMASVNVATEPDLASTRYGTPVVCVGDVLDDLDVDSVRTDDHAGSQAATERLLARGARRVAMVQGPPHAGTAREAGYRAALEAAGLRPDPALMVRGDWTRTGGRRAMTSLLNTRPQPDAVFCANDLTAIGAMDVIHERGLRVPDDVALAGFDDVDAATMVTPALTTVRNPAYDIGAEAGRLLEARMHGHYTGPPRTVVLPCPLVSRASG